MKLKTLKNICIGISKHQYTLERVDIISPYLSVSFFDKLNTLNPKKVFITTDAGCSTNIIEDIKQKLASRLETVKYASCNGIVHAKCYLFHWKNESTNKFRRLFLWGSCNATDGGFERNVEIFSWVKLSEIDQEQRQKMIDYFTKIRRNNKSVDGVLIKIHDGISIELPDIKFYTENASTFDLWIQRGRLCHKFPNDQSFRHLKITLLNKLLPQNDLSNELSKNNLEINQQTTISYDYLRHKMNILEDTASDDKFTSTWKSRYFIDTTYGLWTSEDCFNKNNSGFHKIDSLKRKDEIAMVVNATPSQRDKWSKEFLDILISIDKSIPDSSQYFHYTENKVLDIDKYKKLFLNQLNRDYLRAQDSWFKKGYISGYEFPEVPPIREFGSNWNELISSFSSSLFFEINKRGTRSWLAQTIRDYTDINTSDNSDDLLKELRNFWDNHKEYIQHFHYSNE